MRRNPNRGRVYRCCACRDSTGRLGPRCPKLSNARHGGWAFAVDLPSLNKRSTMRRTGFATKGAASAAHSHVLECERAGVSLDDSETVASYLTCWLEAKSPTLKTNTMNRYTAYIHNDLIPALGAVPLERLTHDHVTQFIQRELAAGRSPVTLRRCVTNLSSALNDARRNHRLPQNAARFAMIPRPPEPELTCWSTSQTSAFLRHCHAVEDPLADLFGLMVCTGMRKGETLGLHWADVDLDARALFVRWTLVSVDNSRTMLNAPKTPRQPGLGRPVHPRRRRVAAATPPPMPATVTARHHDNLDLVFARPDGQPLRPQYVLDHLRRLTADAGLPAIRVHDLRHIAATIMISQGVPIAVVSKTLRHRNVATTIDIYGHLTRDAAAGVSATCAALDAADARAA
ncbi:tyrosine-type recombinase/integrase [Micromonospora sp. NPDC023737]|uniref:tyrosine-type recombinase/integrase n=1 Tax=unclassified Micromonospora TaxID=2617518 RepID=UPI0033E4C18A